MIEFFSYFNPDLYAAPLLIIYVCIALYAIGWFCSTDYYDKVHYYMEIRGINEPPIRITGALLLAAITVIEYLNGTAFVLSMLLNSILWVLLAIPLIHIACLRICKTRKIIRKKRGKF